METPTTYHLVDEVRGLSSKRIYGRCGDEVTLIADRGDVMIVEKDGVRFPAQRRLLALHPAKWHPHGDTAVASLAQVATEPPPAPKPVPRAASPPAKRKTRSNKPDSSSLELF